MAIRERNGVFQVYWNNPWTGKRESKSCRTRSEAEKEDSLIKHRLRFERESFQREEAKQEAKTTFESIYMAYLQEKQFSKSELSSHLSAMRPMLSWIGALPIREIDAKMLEAVKSRTLASTRTQATAKNRLSILRTVIRWASAKGYCELPRFPQLPSPCYQRFIPPAPQELLAMLKAAPPHLQRVILIGSQCGVRVGPSELFALRWQDVDLAQGILRVQGARKNMAAMWREIPIKDSLMDAFRAWREADREAGSAYVIHMDGKPLQSIKRSWATILRNAGITRRIRPYDLRHSFATELIAAGVDIGTVAKLMGHSSPAMILKHYQYVMDRQKRDAIEALPRLHVPDSMCQKDKGATDLQ